MKYNTFTVTDNEESIKCEYPVGIEYLTFLGRYRKGLFKLSEQRIISEEFVDLGNYYQSIFNNSKEFPMVLHSNPKSRLYTSSFLSYYSIMYYKDTGNVGINYTIKTLGLSLKNNKAFTVKEDRYTLYIEKKSGKPSMFLNKKLCYTNLSLHLAFQELSVIMRTPLKVSPNLDVLKKALEEYFIPADSDKETSHFSHDSSKLIALYRVKRSYKLLKDLPWKQEDLTSLYLNNNLSPENLAKQREKILVQLRKGNTKKATALCFYGYSFPKSIKSLVFQQQPLSRDKKYYKSLKDALSLYDINTVKAFYQATPSYFNSLLMCLDIGFSSKHILNVSKNNLGILRDTVRLHFALRNEEKEFNSNMYDYHDYLNNLYNLRNPRVKSFGVDYHSIYESVDTSEEYERFESGNYIFRSPKTANELKEVGQSLNICVGSYCLQFFCKHLDIVLITDKEDNYIGCIEIKLNFAVQGKLRFNRQIILDKNILEATNAWMEKTGIDPYTSDLTSTTSYDYIEDNLPDMSRVKLITDHANKFKGKETSPGIEYIGNNPDIPF